MRRPGRVVQRRAVPADSLERKRVYSRFDVPSVPLFLEMELSPASWGPCGEGRYSFFKPSLYRALRATDTS